MLADLATEVVETARDEYDGSVTVEIPDDLRLTIQPRSAKITLTNLVENALQHVPDAVVTVGAKVKGDDVVLTVATTAPACPNTNSAYWSGAARRT